DSRDGTRYWWRDSVLVRERDGRVGRLVGGYSWVDQAAEDPGGRLWVLRADGLLDVVVGDSLASACVGCVAPSLQAIREHLRGPPRLLGVTVDAFGRLWGWSSHAGLVVVYQREDGAWAHRWFGRAEGLPSAEVNVVFPTPDGRLWVGTGRGLLA